MEASTDAALSCIDSVNSCPHHAGRQPRQGGCEIVDAGGERRGVLWASWGESNLASNITQIGIATQQCGCIQIDILS